MEPLRLLWALLALRTLGMLSASLSSMPPRTLPRTAREGGL